MGVPGLWDLVRPAAVRTSLAALGRDAFQQNRNGLRAFTIGIDASIWIFHAQMSGHQGLNPFLRTIFFKITALLQHPVLPVFVFDGPKKPQVKRGKRVAGRFGVNDAASRQFRQFLDFCGLEWWNAPGEAEAELALMNRQGKIDAVLSDDVDALFFGATCLLRNNSPTLSGAQASSTQNNSARSELRHYEMYRATDIRNVWTAEDSALKTLEDCRMAMVLVALLSGGDYVPDGISRLGPTIAMALAKAGCADCLHLYADTETFTSQLPAAHQRIVNELRTNSTGHVGRKYVKNAATLESVAPEELLMPGPLESYLTPVTSSVHDPAQGWPGFSRGEPSISRGRARNSGRGDMDGMARACEFFFEWGTKDLVIKKFASEHVNLFGAEIVAEARTKLKATEARAAASKNQSTPGSSGLLTRHFATAALSRATSAPKSDHLVKIHATRPCPTSDDITEYRIIYKPKGYADRCLRAMRGDRADPSTLTPVERAAMGLVGSRAEKDDDKEPFVLKDEFRVWVADYLVEAAWPDLVEEFKNAQAAKAVKSTPKKSKASVPKSRPKKNAPVATTENAAAFRGFFTQTAGAGPSRPTAPKSRPRSGSGSSDISPPCPVARTSRQKSPSLPNLATHTSSRKLTPTSSDPILSSTHPTSSASDSSFTPSSPIRSSRARAARTSTRTTRTTREVSITSSVMSITSSLPPSRRTPSPRAASVVSMSSSISVLSAGNGSSGSPIEILDSSDDDTPTPRVLRPSAASNVDPPLTEDPTNRAVDASPSKRPGSRPASVLGSPTKVQKHTATDRAPAPASPVFVASSPPPSTRKPSVSSTSRATASLLDAYIIPRPAKKGTAKASSPRKSPAKGRGKAFKVPHYSLTIDDEGEEFIDLTAGRE